MILRRLTPRFLEKIWGSARLDPWFPNKGRKIGEVWFEDTEPLPLLVKFIFTSDKLSVQVHPGDEYALRHHNSLGKTEMWHILAAEPGARIAAGFRKPVSCARLREAALSGEIENLLEWHDAAPGDTFFIPAGTVHAIGAGLVLCEIQQHSDITYRLYDYGRMEKGRPRELHIDHALAVSRRERYEARQQPAGETLVSCDYFTTTRHRVDGGSNLRAYPGGLDLFIVTEGSGRISGQAVRAGEVWLAPPGGPELRAEGGFTFLRART